MRVQPLDKATFTTLFRTHHGCVHANLRRLGVPDAAVDDASQEVFLVVAFRFGETSPVSERAWILGIVRRIAHRVRRGDHRRLRLTEALAHEADDLSDGTAAVESQEAARQLERFLARLDDRHREVFVFAELEGMTAPEIAESLRLNINTVYSRWRIARQAFDRTFARARLHDSATTGESMTGAVLLSRARSAYAPSAARKARVLALLLALLPGGGLALAGGLRALSRSNALAGKAFMWTASLGLVGVFATATAAPAASAPIDRVTPVSFSTGGPAKAHAIAGAGEGSTRAPDGVVPRAGPANRPPRPSNPAPTARPPQITPELPGPPPVDAAVLVMPDETARKPAEAAPPPPPLAIETAKEDPLTRESALLADALAAFQHGDPQRAKRLLDQHALEFPRGVLAIERELTLVDVLCALGQPRESRARAGRFAAHAYPGVRAPTICGEHSVTENRPVGD